MDRYTVYKESPGGVKKPIYYADSYEEALAFCEEHDWTWIDDNSFEWSLDFVE